MIIKVNTNVFRNCDRNTILLFLNKTKFSQGAKKPPRGR
nr:MAG TPA: hypothetical protein [Caudoviricetes sp.]DAN49154.1 MAG TPA: hypothetical protein [Caudoviricetes sp.]